MYSQQDKDVADRHLLDALEEWLIKVKGVRPDNSRRTARSAFALLDQWTKG